MCGSKTKILRLAIFSSSFIICALALGQESEAPQTPSIQFELGGGEVRVETVGVNIPEAALQRLRTNLLVDDRIAEVVTAQAVTRIVLQGDQVTKVVAEVERASSRLADQLQEGAVKELTGQGDLSRQESEDAGRREDDGEIYFADDVRISAGEQRKDLVVMAGDVSLEGRVNSLIVVGGNVDLAPGAEIKGDLLVIGGDVHLSAGSRIGDELVMIGGKFFDEPGSFVGSKRTITPKFKIGSDRWHGPQIWPHLWMVWWSRLLSGVLGFFLAWGVLVLLQQWANEFLVLARNFWSERKLASTLSGFGVVLSFLPGLLFLIVTLIGILLVPVYLLAVAALNVIVYAIIIERLGYLFFVQREMPLWQRVLLGQVCWLILGAIPFVGGLAMFAFWILGLGACMQATTRRFLAPT